MVLSDTIAAIATAIVPQQGSIGIVRLSGPEAVSIARQIFHSLGHQVWESHLDPITKQWNAKLSIIDGDIEDLTSPYTKENRELFGSLLTYLFERVKNIKIKIPKTNQDFWNSIDLDLFQQSSTPQT